MTKSRYNIFHRLTAAFTLLVMMQAFTNLCNAQSLIETIDWTTFESGSRYNFTTERCCNGDYYIVEDNSGNDYNDWLWFRAPDGCKIKITYYKIGNNGIATGGNGHNGQDRIYYRSANSINSNNADGYWNGGTAAGATYTSTGRDMAIRFYNNRNGNSKFRIRVETTGCPTRTASITGCPNTTLTVGDVVNLTGYVTAGAGTTTWTSSVTSVATVTNAGRVTAVGPGTTTITYTRGANGAYCEVTATCTITVVAAGGDDCDHTTALVGDDNSTNTTSYSPLEYYYNYNYEQILYTHDEICPPGNDMAVIHSIAFKFYGTTATNVKDDVYIYMGTTQLTEFGYLDDWVTSGLEEVYHGSFDFDGTSGWQWFELDNAYTYYGTDNLVVVILDVTGNYYTDYYSLPSFYSSATDDFLVLYYSDDYSPITDVTNPEYDASYGNYNRPLTKFCVECTNCTARNPMPSISGASTMVTGGTTNLTVQNLLTGDNVTWTSSDNTIATVDNNGVVTARNTGTVTITATVAGNGNKCPATVTHVITITCGETYTAPICFDIENDYLTPTTYIDMDSGLPYCFSHIYSGETRIGATTYSGAPHVTNGSVALDGNGIVMTSGNASFNYGNPNYLVLPQISGITRGYHVSFNAWMNDETQCGTLTLGYMTDRTNPSTFIPIGDAAHTYYNASGAADVLNDFALPDPWPANAVLAFRWTYPTGCVEDRGWVVIDNICLYKPCTPREGAAGFQFCKSQVNVEPGTTFTLPVSGADGVSPMGTSTVVYTSSNTSVASVNSDGKVTAEANGTTIITATIAAETIEGIDYCATTASYTVRVGTAGSGGEECDTIGDKSTYTTSAPIFALYQNSWVQMIYDKSYFTNCDGCYIKSITFISQGNNDYSRDTYIYVDSTDNDEFASNTSFIAPGGIAAYHNDSWNITTGENTFVFSNPIKYSCTKNLLISFLCTATSWQGTGFDATSTSGYTVIYAYSDTEIPTPEDMSGWGSYPKATSMHKDLPDIRICFECPFTPTPIPSASLNPATNQTVCKTGDIADAITDIFVTAVVPEGGSVTLTPSDKGLSYNTTEHKIEGRPNFTGSQTFTLTVKDAEDCLKDEKTFTITVNELNATIQITTP